MSISTGVICLLYMNCIGMGAFNPRLSDREKFENIVIRNRFRYEDNSMETGHGDEDMVVKEVTNEIVEVIDDLEEINDSLNTIIESERDQRRHQGEKIHQINSWNEVYRVLLVSLIGLTLVLIFSVLCNLCSRLCTTQDSDKDPEKIVLVQDRYQQVYHGLV